MGCEEKRGCLPLKAVLWCSYKRVNALILCWREGNAISSGGHGGTVWPRGVGSLFFGRLVEGGEGFLDLEDTGISHLVQEGGRKRRRRVEVVPWD